MTRLPLEEVRIGKPPLGLPEYDWRGLCRVPGCDRPATDPHHVVRRTAGGRTWVLVDGVPVPNIAGLCRWHHDQVTRDEALITWAGPVGWVWHHPAGAALPLLPLLHTVTNHKGGKCPSCGRRWPKPNPFPGMRRRKRTKWEVKAPTDQGEDGEQVLDVLVEQAAVIMGYDFDNVTPENRYYVVAGALYGFLTDPDAQRRMAEGLGGAQQGPPVQAD